MDRFYIHTPLISRKRERQTFYFKLESLQPTGSFKLRGMDHLVRSMMDSGKSGIVSSSGGNAGFCAAYIARELGLKCTVVLPENTPRDVKNKIQYTGATIILHGENWNAADEKARTIAEEENLGYVHPFQHPLLWEGHATVIEECAGEMEEPDAVVVAVGGGGLLKGVAIGMEKVGWNNATIVACETEGAASYKAAVDADELVRLERVDTIASSLGALQVSPDALAIAKERKVINFLCSDLEALNACTQFANDYRVLISPACGAAVASTHHRNVLDPFRHILVIVCGGMEATLKNFTRWQNEVRD